MTTAIANPWTARAENLARWALTRLVNRTDRCGGCYGDPETGDVRRTTRPAGGAKPGYVDLRLLARHFRASATEDVIGLHALGADGFGKWVGVDIDAHPGTKADPDANERFALAIYDRLAVLGFTPLLSESNGKGGFHVRALFEGAVEGPVLFAFGRWLVRDAAEYGFAKPPEVFPKQAVIDGDTKYGNWLRLIGRHHGRDFWGRVWSGSEWLDGDAAVEYVLGIGGDPVELIPDEARTFDPNPRPVPSAPHPHVPLTPGGSTDPETDVFAAYNRAQTMESVGELLKRHRWVPVGHRGERWDFRRPDKNGDKSGNLMLVSGTPIFYGFTDAAGIPDHKGLNPSNLRAALEYPGQFARLAEQLRREGYGPVRSQRPVPTAPREHNRSVPASEDRPVDPVTEEAVNEEFLDPHRLGRLLVPRADGLPTLVYHRAEWWEWRNGRYVTVADDDFDKRAWATLREECEADHRSAVLAWDQDGRKSARPTIVKLDGRKVTNAVQAAASMCHLDGDTTWPVMLKADALRPGHIPKLRPDPDAREYIACANGLIDVPELLATGRAVLAPPTPLYFTPAALPVKFKPGAACPKFEAFLARVTDGDRERQLVLQEMAGYLLRFDTGFQSFFIMTGEGGNGKSTFLAVLRALIGDYNYASVPLEEFGERFALASTLGKLVNAVAEVGEMDKVAEAKLKSFVSGDLMNFDRKNKSALNTRPTARLLLSTNILPRFADRTEGVWRRYTVVPFNVVIAVAERVRGMDSPEWWVASGEMPGVLNWALTGLHRLHAQGGFTSSAVCTAAKAEHRELCNPHKQFLDEHVKEDEGAYLRVGELFAAYQSWCRLKGYKPLNDGNFGAELRKAHRAVKKTRLRVGQDRPHAYAGVAWSEGRPDGLLVEFDRRRRDSAGWSPESDIPM